MSCHCESQKPFAWLCRLTPELPKTTRKSSSCSRISPRASSYLRVISPGLKRKLLLQPVGGQRPVFPRDVVADVVAVVVEQELAARRLRDLALRLLPRDQPVVTAGDREERLVDAVCRVVQVQLTGLLAPVLHRRGAGVMADGLARLLRHVVPVRREVEWAADPDNGLQALLVR